MYDYFVSLHLWQKFNKYDPQLRGSKWIKGSKDYFNLFVLGLQPCFSRILDPLCSNLILNIPNKISFFTQFFSWHLAGRLLIADTNNNIIRYIDLNEKDPMLHTLELRGVQPPSSKPKLLKRLRRRLSADTEIIKIDGGSSKEGVFYLTVSVPVGYHFSKVLLIFRNFDSLLLFSSYRYKMFWFIHSHHQFSQN